MKDNKADLFWLIRMAWREMRRNRLRLLLFVSSICFGVAAVVVIESFRLNLEDAVAKESKSLLGSDLTISSRQIYSDADLVTIDSLGGERSSETRFSSMAYFPIQDEAKLVQVRAQEGVFPFYGAFITEPKAASGNYKSKGGALVDRNLQIQLELSLHDSIRVGSVAYEIAGFFDDIPGEAATASVFSGPRVYVPLSGLDQALLDRGSRVSRRFRFKFPQEDPILESEVEALRERFPRPEYRVTSVDDAAENLGNALRDLYRFLGIAGLVALILGSIGIASSIYVYIRRKIPIIATFRCIGFDPQTCTRIFLTQALIVGLLSTLAGIAIGWGLVSAIPSLIQDFIPVEIPGSTRWAAVFVAFAAGFGISIVSSLIPLSQVQTVSPMSALRSGVQENGTGIRGNKLAMSYVGLTILSFCFIAIYLTGEFLRGLGLIFGIMMVILLLLAVAKALILLVKRLRLKAFSYPVRQGISNLYRPNNQTSTLLVVLGLGAFLIASLSIVQSSLLGRFDAIGAEDAPNTLLFDIQGDQLEGVRTILANEGTNIVDDAPVVTMRLSKLRDIPVADIKEDSTSNLPGWALSREYRSTFRNNIKSSEKIIAGNWHDSDGGLGNRISLEESLAEDLQVEVGDKMSFNVQGVELEVVVTSIREVNWFAFESNFFVVFEEGILEQAPRFHIIVGKTATETLPVLQRNLVKAYPNVSVVDASTVLVKASDIIGKITLIVRVMALFCIFTGIIVLIASLTMSRSQRFRENALLKTLGAKSKQISVINSIEYLFLGTLATLTGLVLAIIAAWALVKFVFEIPLNLPFLSLATLFCGIVGLTLFIGFLSSLGISRRPPMEVLRMEVV